MKYFCLEPNSPGLSPGHKWLLSGIAVLGSVSLVVVASSLLGNHQAPSYRPAIPLGKAVSISAATETTNPSNSALEELEPYSGAPVWGEALADDPVTGEAEEEELFAGIGYFAPADFIAGNAPQGAPVTQPNYQLKKQAIAVETGRGFGPGKRIVAGRPASGGLPVLASRTPGKQADGPASSPVKDVAGDPLYPVQNSAVPGSDPLPQSVSVPPEDPVITTTPVIPPIPEDGHPTGNPVADSSPNHAPVSGTGHPADEVIGESPSAPKSPAVAGNPTPENNGGGGGESSDPLPQLTGPEISQVTVPDDEWFSPGNSPGIARVDGDFSLDGGTLLFEIMGPLVGDEYDQLIVEGIAELNSGNVVFAFINGYRPLGSDMFDLILAEQILVNLDNVNFYYGLFEDPYTLHAPRNLEVYNTLDLGDGVVDEITLYDGIQNPNIPGQLMFDDVMKIGYMEIRALEREPGSDETFTPLELGRANVLPAPESILLLFTGLLLIGTFWRGRLDV
ncbi:MAG: hypothetical protein KDI63_00125 [Gammaproteobacteria bacterium]|nr:hypothetical protein [Gammaproteobacteria bacterium]